MKQNVEPRGYLDAGHRLAATSPWFQKRWQRRVLVVAAIAVVIQCIYLVRVPPARGFETSVVTPYPVVFWGAMALCLGALIVCFIGSTVDPSNYWRQAFFLLAANRAVFLFLPLAQGYKLYGRGFTDALYHLSITKALLSSGVVTVFYPHLHILMAELSFFGIPILKVQYFIAFIFSLLFVLSVGVLVRYVTGKSHAIGVGLAAATPFVFADYHALPLPAMLSFMLFPLVLLVLYLIGIEASHRAVVLFLVLAYAVVFFHPVSTMLLLVLIGSSVLFARADGVSREISLSYPVGLMLALLPGMFEWYIGQRRTRFAILDILAVTKAPPAAGQVAKAQSVSLSLETILIRFVQLYGTVTILFALAGFFALAVVVRRLRGASNRYTAAVEEYFTIQFVVGFLVAVAFLAVYLIAFAPIRISRYMILMALVLVALFLLRAVETRSSISTWLVLVITGCLVVAAVLSIFTVYVPNKHMTHAEYEGAEFVLAYDSDSLTVHSWSLTRKMQRFVTGESPYPTVFGQSSVPERLGYTRAETARETFGSGYIVTQRFDTEQHTATYFTPAQRRAKFHFDETDVARLGHDSTVEKVYANGGFTTWLVAPGTSENRTESRIDAERTAA